MTYFSSNPHTVKLQFASDNYSSTSPEARHFRDEAESTRHHRPYGDDEWAMRAENALRDFFELPKLEIFFVPTGTAANCLALSHVTRKGKSIACHQTAHLVTDEGCAPHYFSHSKLFQLPGKLGQIEPDCISNLFQRADKHYSKPDVLSVTQTTECGTVYSLELLESIMEEKIRHNFYLHMDGARFANAVVHLGVTPKEITWKRGVDMMTFGVTKNGAPTGEVIIFFDSLLAKGFSDFIKSTGHLVSKSVQITAPICGLLETGEFLKNAEHANHMALELEKELRHMFEEQKWKTDPIAYPVQANSVFVRFPDVVLNSLRKRGYVIYDFIAGCSRLMCSWNTQSSDITELVSDIHEVMIDCSNLTDALTKKGHLT